MRILLVHDWVRGRGGAEANVIRLRDGLRAAGDDVCLLTSSAGTAGDGTAEYVTYGSERRAAQVLLQIVNPLAVATVRRAVKHFRPEAAWINMFAHHLSPAAILALGDVPKVMLVSDYKVICPTGLNLLPDGSVCHSLAGWVCHRSGCLSLPHWLRDQPRYALIRSAVGKTDRVLACSRWVQRELAEAGIESRVLYLPVADPPPHFVRKPDLRPAFVYCGRLNVEKGVDSLIHAFARLQRELPEARLRIAGHGPEREKLERLASSLGMTGAVTFLGWQSAIEIDDLLAGAWASVVPSLWAEPQGMVAVEAIVRKVPVVASSAGGLGEIVEHGVSGLLFQNHDEEGLFNCLRAIASKGAFPEHVLSEEVARRAASEFSIRSHVERMRGIFAEIARRT